MVIAKASTLLFLARKLCVLVSLGKTNPLIQLLIKENFMLNYVITFFILAVVASVLGFGGLAADFAEIARFLAVVFVFLFIGSLVYSIITGRRANPPL
jgi:uncharacterized membrane protein YtjA (UPF0391 family)